jgi:hypothetical protein
VRRATPASSGGVSTGQNKGGDERTTVSATTAVASSGTTKQVQIGSSSGTELAGKKITADDNLLCTKCGKKGHTLKDCKEDIECVNCGKGHQSMRCAWLKQKKPTTNLVGFVGLGLCCFVAEHTKEGDGAEETGKAIAIVKVKDVDFHVDEELLVMCLGRTYPWKWTWQAKEVSAGRFLVNFPSAARINEVSIYDWVTLRGAHIKVNVKQWSYENLAAGKLDIVWVRAKRVPKALKNYQEICEVGSTLGHVVEVDMEAFRRDGSIRFLVGVVNYKNIPAMAKLTTKKLMIYYIYFQVEQVV